MPESIMPELGSPQNLEFGHQVEMPRDHGSARGSSGHQGRNLGGSGGYYNQGRNKQWISATF